MTKKQLMEKIEKTNEAFQKLRDSIKLIKEAFPRNNDIEVYLWRISKQAGMMFKKLSEIIDQDIIDDEFNEIIKKFDKKNGKDKK